MASDLTLKEQIMVATLRLDNLRKQIKSATKLGVPITGFDPGEYADHSKNEITTRHIRIGEKSIISSTFVRLSFPIDYHNSSYRLAHITPLSIRARIIAEVIKGYSSNEIINSYSLLLKRQEAEPSEKDDNYMSVPAIVVSHLPFITGDYWAWFRLIEQIEENINEQHRIIQVNLRSHDNFDNNAESVILANSILENLEKLENEDSGPNSL